jgi:glycogen debranching enzyme
MYEAALHNVLDINTVAGRNAGEPPYFVRAGGGYSEPWTRDASINAWGVVSVLRPDVARDTLLMVCGRQPDGRRIIAQDDQWWDQIIWVIAAWQHYLVSGDREFLTESYQIGLDSLEVLNHTRFRKRYGLYAGGAFMQDGISGYPQPPNDPAGTSSFVLDYPAAHEIMCLSTNAIYVGAMRSLARMADLLGGDPAGLRAAADRLSGAINERLWIEEAGHYGYFLHGDGTLDRHQEAAGLALAVAFGIADAARADRVFAATHRSRYGVVNVWPHFAERYSDDIPGRHNVMCWPMVMGLFGDAAALAGRADVVVETVRNFEALGGFSELYNPVTGAVYGGWQCGRQWASQPDQTWSATAFLRLVHNGLIGIRYGVDGISFAPSAGGLRLTDFPYRAASLDITVDGPGEKVTAVEVDGAATHGAIPPDLTRRHRVAVHLSSVL